MPAGLGTLYETTAGTGAWTIPSEVVPPVSSTDLMPLPDFTATCTVKSPATMASGP